MLSRPWHLIISYTVVFLFCSPLASVQHARLRMTVMSLDIQVFKSKELWMFGLGLPQQTYLYCIVYH